MGPDGDVTTIGVGTVEKAIIIIIIFNYMSDLYTENS